MRYIKPDEAWKQLVINKAIELVNQASLIEPTFSLSIKTDVAVPEGSTIPQISITYRASVKMWALINSNDSKEIGWNGLVRRNGNDFTIYDILMYPQMTSAATVTTDDTKYSEWINSLTDESFDNLRFHGHSHVRMGTSPSGVDTTYQHQLIKDVKDYFIFGIFNLRRENYLCLYDIVNNIMYETKDIIFMDYMDAAYAWAKKEMESNLHTAVVTTVYSGLNKTETAQTPSQQQGSTYDSIKRELNPTLYGIETETGEDYWERYY